MTYTSAEEVISVATEHGSVEINNTKNIRITAWRILGD